MFCEFIRFFPNSPVAILFKPFCFRVLRSMRDREAVSLHGRADLTLGPAAGSGRPYGRERRV